MIYQKLRKVGNSYVVTIPKDEVERLHLQEGQYVAFEAYPAEIRPLLPADLQEAMEESWKRNESGYRYLAGR